MYVCELEDYDFTDEQIKRARRAYYSAVSYVDNCIGQLLKVLKACGLEDNTIIMFSGDHGDMLDERRLWYKMSYFEASVRVPLMLSHPKQFSPHRVLQNVSTLDILPTLVDLVGAKLVKGLPLDGISLMPHLYGGDGGYDTVYAEYMGEGTVAPIVMIRRGSWKYTTCPADPSMLYNLSTDPLELTDLSTSIDSETQAVFNAFEQEAKVKWDMKRITEEVQQSQRQRLFIHQALMTGRYESWDWKGHFADDGRLKYIRSNMLLDELELKARFPIFQNMSAKTMQVHRDGMDAVAPSKRLTETTSDSVHYR